MKLLDNIFNDTPSNPLASTKASNHKWAPDKPWQTSNEPIMSNMVEYFSNQFSQNIWTLKNQEYLLL